jgi:predicted ATPase/DNA-binding SARP family transcriptional activator
MGGARFHFSVLGALRIQRDGETLVLSSGRQRALLALLLQADGRPIVRDRLVDELWQQRPPATAVAALHVHMAKLRELIGDLLVLDTGGYWLRPDRYELDSRNFERLLAEARGATATDPQSARANLRQALELVRGEPLSDLPAEGSIGLWRQLLEEEVLQATLLDYELRLDGGADSELIAALEKLLVAHAFEERAWIVLITALERAGRRAEALDAYQRARRLFAKELGIDPSPRLQALQAKILTAQGAPSVSESTESAAPAETGQVESFIPAPPTPTVGRDSDLAELANLLEGGSRLITVVGPGGVGKTRVLVELARRSAERFPDGVVFVPLEQLEDAELLEAEIALALSRRPGAQSLTVDALAAHLQGREMLIALDNFEHLSDAAKVVAKLLEQAPKLTVAVSSRSPLRIRGEDAYEIEPLRLPRTHGLEEVLASPAAQLFLARLRAAGRRLNAGVADFPDAGSAQMVAAVCEAVDGLPLGIELAAARAATLGLELVAEQVSEPLALGENALSDLPRRHRTLTDTIGWSYDLLSERARPVFRASGAFLGSFSADALAATAGRESVLPELEELVSAGLIRVARNAGRFELLPLVRVFAERQLAEAEEAVEVYRAHAGHYVKVLRHVVEAFDAGTAPGELARLVEVDHPNLRQALDRAIERGESEAAAGLALALRPVWFTRMQDLEGQRLIGRVLDRLEVASEVELRLLRAASFLESWQTDDDDWTLRLVDRAAVLGDSDAQAVALVNLFGAAMNARRLDRLDELRPQLQAILSSGVSDRALVATAYHLAIDAYANGEFEQAAELASLSLERAQAIGFDYQAGTAASAVLLAGSARDGVIELTQLKDLLDLISRASVETMNVCGLWFVASYAAGIGSGTAVRWLALAESILVSLGIDLWPESLIRDETLAALGIELSDLSLETDSPDHRAALAQARMWLETRPADECSPRVVLRLTSG